MIMVHFFPIPCLVGMGLLVMLLMRLRQQRQNPARLFFYSLFWLYLLLLLDAVLFPLPLQSISGPVLTGKNILNTLARVNFHLWLLRRARLHRIRPHSDPSEYIPDDPLWFWN